MDLPADRYPVLIDLGIKIQPFENINLHRAIIDHAHSKLNKNPTCGNLTCGVLLHFHCCGQTILLRVQNPLGILPPHIEVMCCPYKEIHMTSRWQNSNKSILTLLQNSLATAVFLFPDIKLPKMWISAMTNRPVTCDL